jgi:competence protein ComEC
MFTWARIPFVRITLFFISGIALALAHPEYHLAASVLLATNFLLLIGLVIAKSQLLIKLNTIYGLAISLSFVAMGYLTLWLNSDSFNRQHILYHSGLEVMEVEVRSAPEEKTKSLRILSRVIRVKDSMQWHNATGKLLIYLEPGAEVPEFGDHLIVKGRPARVKPPANPHQFNYRNYLEHNNIYHTLWVGKEDWLLKRKATRIDLFRYANMARSNLEDIFEKVIGDIRALGIIKALVLGNKVDLDPETRTLFANAGAIHVLAVSGLHVGIIYLILIIGLKPLNYKLKMSWLTPVFIILCLWVYAFITGLPASVLRAVTMFTILEIGRQSGRDSSTFNSLALSAFIPLLINPLLITQVGFQLSYLAVGGILLLYKPIASLVKIQNKAIKFLWQITALSIAAQVATAPLAAYYFNQLPTYSLVSNLVVIPAVTVLVWGGIGTLMAGLISIELGRLLAIILEYVVNILELILDKLVALPFSTISNIFLGQEELMLIYLFIGLLLTAILSSERKVYVLGMAMVTLVFLGFRVSRLEELINRQEIVFYSLNQNHWAVDFIANGKYTFISDSLLDDKSVQYSIQPNRTTLGLSNAGSTETARIIDNLGQVIVWQEKSILIAESCAHDLKNREQFDFILQPAHPRYLDCYSDQNLLIKLVNEEGFTGHDLKTAAYVAPL